MKRIRRRPFQKLERLRVRLRESESAPEAAIVPAAPGRNSAIVWNPAKSEYGFACASCSFTTMSDGEYFSSEYTANG